MNQSFFLIPVLYCSVFLLSWYAVYFTSGPVPSVDLPSHIALVELMIEQLGHGRIVFYDHTMFSGWVPFHFYGFLPALLNAVLAILLEPMSIEPVRLAAHLLLLFGAALLPFSFLFATRPLVRELLGESFDWRAASVHAVLSCVFCFWFLNHDEQWFGIGAAAPMNIGLLSQLFGWHFLLWYLRSLFCLLEGSKSGWKYLALWYGALLITHTLTFVFASFLGFFYLIWSSHKRKELLLAHFTGVALVSFWFLPMAYFLGEFTAYDPHRPQGDFLQLLFRYPWFGVVRSLSAGEFFFHPINLLAPLFLILIVGCREFRSTHLFWGLFISGILGGIVFSSGFIASSIPFGFHYYRFLGYLFLIFVLMFLCVPMIFLRGARGSVLREGSIVVLCLLAFFMTLRMPHYEREMIKEKANTSYLSDEDSILEFFRDEVSGGRVYFEYINSYKTFPPLSAHYLDSSLSLKTGNESMVNSHLQESMTYRYVTAAASGLGANTYSVPHLYKENYFADDEQKLDQLRELGITHIVSGKKTFRMKLEELIPEAPKKFGRYRIFTLQEPPFSPVKEIDKWLIGYRDIKKNLPVSLLQKYFYAHGDLYSQFELVDLSDLDQIPVGIDILLLNTEDPDESERMKASSEVKKVIPINFKNRYHLDHYDVHYPHNVELDLFRAIHRYLSTIIRLPERLVEFSEDRVGSSSILEEEANLRWLDEEQQLHLSGLKKDRWYRINYSYFPYWQSDDALVLRGLGERMLLLPESEEVTLTFSRFSHWTAWGGLFLSFLAIGLLVLLPSKRMDRQSLGYTMSSKETGVFQRSESISPLSAWTFLNSFARNVFVHLPLIFLVWIAVVKIEYPELNRLLTYENGIYEWFQFGCFFLAALVASVTAGSFYRQNKRVLFSSFLFLAAALFFVSFEEISWGQWLFDLSPPEIFEQRNTQKNITLHNLDTVQPYLHLVFILFGIFVGCSMIFKERISRRFRRDVFQRILPGKELALYFLPIALFFIYTDYLSPLLERWNNHWATVSFDYQETFIFFSDQESLEVLLALGFLLFTGQNFLIRKIDLSRDRLDNA